jgi:hypothetical protein
MSPVGMMSPLPSVGGADGLPTDLPVSAGGSATASGQQRSSVYRFCRAGKRIARDARDRAIRALAFAKLLTNDLEICAKFALATEVGTLMRRLYDTQHVMVTPQIQQEASEYVMFCERPVAEDDEHLQLLLNMTCGRDEHEVPDYLAGRAGYLLLCKCTPEEKAAWPGAFKTIVPDPDTKLSLQYMQVDAVYLVVVNSKTLHSQREALRRHISDEFITIVEDQCSCHEIIAQDMNQLKATAMCIRDELAATVDYLTENMLDEQLFVELDGNQRQTYRDTVIQAYNLVFDYHRELARLVSAQMRPALARAIVVVIERWSQFVRDAFERGHRAVPRWAHHSLNFLVLALNPDSFTRHLDDDEFHTLKQIIDDTVCHIVGEHRVVVPVVGKPVPTKAATVGGIVTSKDNALSAAGQQEADERQREDDSQSMIHHVESAVGILRPTPSNVHTGRGANRIGSFTNSPQMFSPPPSPPTQRQRRMQQRQLLGNIDILRTKRLQAQRRIGREVDKRTVTGIGHIEGRRAPYSGCWDRLFRKTSVVFIQISRT